MIPLSAAVPDSLMVEIQQLQDTFGAVTSQALVLTDQEGNLITRPTIAGRFYKEIIDSLQHIHRPFEQTLRRLGALSHPAVLDRWIPGLKYIITPLVPEYGEIYYLWSGLYMEEGAKELVLQAFESKMKNHPEYDQLSSELSALPESSSERIFEIRDKIAVLGSILCKLIGGSALKPVTERNTMMISRLLTHLEEDFLKIEEVLQQLAGTFSAADLYAFAKENDEGQFKVNYAAGKEAHLLLNAVFPQGDGFFGQAVLGKDPRHWTDIAKDPRSLYFTRRGMTLPESLSCYPVLINNGKRSLLLAISFGRNEQVQGFDRQEQIVASLLGISDWGEMLLRRGKLLEEGTFLFKEAARLLPQALSRKDLGMQLLDVVMAMPFYPSSTLVYFQEIESSNITYFSRGWASDEDALYVKGLESRYSQQSFLSSALIFEAAGGSVLLECPLLSGNEFKGLLSVGFRGRSEAEQWQTFIESVACLATAAIRLLEKEERYLEQAEALLTELRRYLQNVNTKLSSLSLDASNMAADFARYIGLTEEEAERVVRAALLSPFQIDALTEFGYYPDEILLLQQVDELASQFFTVEKPSLPLSGQVLALILQHTGRGADQQHPGSPPHKWIDPSRYSKDYNIASWIEDKRISSFQSFLLSREDSRPKKRIVSAARLLDSPALTTLKEEWGVSPREEEVLELIVHGKTNKEIASTLFISEHTVKNHLSRIFNKMNVTDRSHIIALIYKKILDAERIEI